MCNREGWECGMSGGRDVRLLLVRLRAVGGMIDQNFVFCGVGEKGEMMKKDMKKGARKEVQQVVQQPSSEKKDAPVESERATWTTADGTELPAKLNNKAFVDGLPYNETPGGPTLFDALFKFCMEWHVGKLVKLIKKPGQGFGYLCFHSPNSVMNAIQVLNGVQFLGRRLRVEEPKARTSGTASDAAVKDSKSNYAKQALISDLKNAQPDILRSAIRDQAPSLEGRIESIKIVGGGRKAFVTFFAESDVEPFVNFMNGRPLLGRKVAACAAQPPGSLPFSKVQNAPLLPTPPPGETETPVVEAKVDLLARNERERELPETVVGGSSEIYVGNISDDTTEDQLKKHFAGCGHILQCEVLVNGITHQSSGIGRIEFATAAHALYAQQHLDGSRLNGNRIRVDRTNESRGPSDLVRFENEDDEASHEKEDSDVDEEGYMREYGVENPEEFFAGTSVGYKAKKKHLNKEQGAAQPKKEKQEKTKEFKKRPRLEQKQQRRPTTKRRVE